MIRPKLFKLRLPPCWNFAWTPVTQSSSCADTQVAASPRFQAKVAVRPVTWLIYFRWFCGVQGDFLCTCCGRGFFFSQSSQQASLFRLVSKKCQPAARSVRVRSCTPCLVAFPEPRCMHCIALSTCILGLRGSDEMLDSVSQVSAGWVLQRATEVG